MVEVKLQRRLSGQGKDRYFTYVITLPKSIVEALPELAKVTVIEKKKRKTKK